jgi:hypothetical protein
VVLDYNIYFPILVGQTEFSERARRGHREKEQTPCSFRTHHELVAA